MGVLQVLVVYSFLYIFFTIALHVLYKPADARPGCGLTWLHTDRRLAAIGPRPGQMMG